MSIIEARGLKPQIEKDVFVAEGARIIGETYIAQGASIWFNVVIRGDVMPIRIGKETNIQDGSVLHGTYGKFGCEIGDRVTVGHSAILHGCKIGNLCLVGMGSVVMDGVEVGERSVIAAGSLLTQGKKYPPKSMIVGRPAVVVRPLNADELDFLEQSADNYLLYKTWYK